MQLANKQVTQDVWDHAGADRFFDKQRLDLHGCDVARPEFVSQHEQ
jgi:hypothetical protein